MPNDAPDWTSVQHSHEEVFPGSPFTFARDGLFHSMGTPTIPQGATALCISTATKGDLENLTVIGQTTSIDYSPHNVVGLQQFVYVRLHPQMDAQIQVRAVISGGVGSAIVAVVWLYGTDVPELDPKQSSAVYLSTQDAIAYPPTVTITGQNIPEFGFDTSLPPKWASADFAIDMNISSLANGGTASLRGGVSNQIIYMAGVHIGYDDTSSNITIEDSVTGKVLWRGTYNQNESGLTNSSNFETDCHWVKTAVGSGLLVRNASGGARNIFGTVYGSQF